MISEDRRAVLARKIAEVLNEKDAANFINAVRKDNVWASIVPLGTHHLNQLREVVRVADQQGWLETLVARLVEENSAAFELAALLEEIRRSVVVPTSPNAIDEVLLGSGRPFVNRSNLRTHLLSMTSAVGAPVLLIDGAGKCGKSYSFYLINHVAQDKGFEAHKFSVATSLRPNELAAEILERIGEGADLPAIGNESAERWAGKLATIVYNKLKGGVPRVLVFDEFPVTRLPDGTILDVPLPDGTASFLVRLTKYADEELYGKLRIVFMRFREPLPVELEDVALREEALRFSEEHMVGAIMQVATARNWSVSADAIRKKVEDFHQASPRTLSESFKFLRDLLRELAT